MEGFGIILSSERRIYQAHQPEHWNVVDIFLGYNEIRQIQFGLACQSEFFHYFLNITYM
jgi:hypothetical protein